MLMQKARRGGALLGALLASGLCAQPACAQQGQSQDMPAAEDNDRPADQVPDPAPKKKKKRDLLFAPVPLSDPAQGTGLAVGGVMFWNPNNEPNQWVTGGGAVYTSKGTKGVGAFHSMSFGGDRVRLTGNASYFDNKSTYYGIGIEAGDRGETMRLNSKELNIIAQGQVRVIPHGYAGAKFRFLNTDATPDDPDTPTLSAPPEDQRHSTLLMLGPALSYDMRDDGTEPHSGYKLNLVWMFGWKALGDSYTHNKLALDGNVYFPFGQDTVLATRASLCSAGGDAPYYDLCTFGSANDLRGYPTGRYRDGARWATQAELRHQFTNRWGGAFFIGLGGVASSVGDIWDDGNLLPAAGVGARYKPFKGNNVRVRLDVAVGKNDKGVYLGIGQAF